MSVVVTAIFQPAEGRRDQLVAALQKCIPAVHQEGGCLLYAIHDAADGTITMLEKWDTTEDLDQHSAGPAVETLNAAIEGLVAGPVTVTRMAPIPAGTREQGEL